MKVCDVCDLVNGRAFKPSDWGSSGLPIVRIQNLNNESAPFNYYSGEYNPAHEINDGELLFSWSGTPGTSFGAFRWYRGKGILNQHIYKVVPKINIDKDYLKYALNGNLSRIISKAHGGVGLQHITKKELNEITLRIVSNDEQRKIVALLNQTQNVIELRRTQLAKLDELVKCRFVELFGDPVANDKGWPIVRLDAIADIRIGPFGSLLHKEDYQSGNHALVNPSHIVEGKIKVDSTLSVSNNKYNELSAYWLNPGDIVMGRRGEMGRCAVVEHSGLICGTGSLIIRTHGQMKPYFLQNILSRPEYKKIIEVKAVGVTMMNLNVPIVSSLEVPLLPHEQQIEFLGFTHRIDKLRMGVQAALDKAQTLFDSLMQEYFG